MINQQFIFMACILPLTACQTSIYENPSALHDPFNARQKVKNALHDIANPPSNICTAPDWQNLNFMESITGGLCNHPDTRAAYAEIERQAASWGETQGSYLPALSLSYRKEITHNKTSFNNGIPDSRSRQNPNRSMIELQWVLFIRFWRTRSQKQAKLESHQTSRRSV